MTMIINETGTSVYDVMVYSQASSFLKSVIDKIAVLKASMSLTGETLPMPYGYVEGWFKGLAPANFQEVLASVQTQYDNVQGIGFNIISDATSMYDEVKRQMSAQTISAETIKQSQLVWAKIQENFSAFLDGKEKVKALIGELWNVNINPYTIKTSVPVSVVETAKTVDAIKEVGATAVTQAKANPILVVGLAISALRLLK